MQIDGRQNLLDRSLGPVTVIPSHRATPAERARALPPPQAGQIVTRLAREARESGGREALLDVYALVSPVSRRELRALSLEVATQGLLEAVTVGRLIAIPGWRGLEAPVSAQLPARPALAAAVPPPLRVAPPPSPPEDPATDAEPTIRLTNLEAPHFVPGQETLGISYAIDGPVGKAAEVRILVRSMAPSGERAVLHRSLLPKPYGASGTVEWDGSADIPGGLITLRGAPYEVTFALTSTSGKRSTSAPATVKVEVHSVTIEVTDQGPLAVAPDHKWPIERLIDQLRRTGMPGDCRGPVLIDSPVFFIDYDELSDRTSAREYARSAGVGMPVPLVATVSFRSKTGEARRSPAALLGTRLLWDFRHPNAEEFATALRARNATEEQIAFLTRALSQPDGIPGGVAAHAILGGRRGRLDRHAFWKSRPNGTLQQPTERTWAAFVECEDRPGESVDSAVYFISGHIGGDTHKLRAILDVNGVLDTADVRAVDQVPSVHQSNSITLTNWRRVPITANWFMSGDPELSGMALYTVASLFYPAALTPEIPPGQIPIENPGVIWRERYRAMVEGMVGGMKTRKRAFLRDALELDPQEYPVRFRSYSDYVARLAATGLQGTRLRERLKFFEATSEDDYRRRCDRYVDPIIISLVPTLPLPAEGLVFLKFGSPNAHNQSRPGKGWSGVALFVPGVSTRSRAVVLQCTEGSSPDTTVHEIGHSLFLNHAPGGLSPADPSYPRAHARVEDCLMSYHDYPSSLCGLCLLKLAGCQYWKLDSDGSVRT